jgi:hypothetical protein
MWGFFVLLTFVVNRVVYICIALFYMYVVCLISPRKSLGALSFSLYLRYKTLVK